MPAILGLWPGHPQSARAAQFTLLDTNYTHTTATMAFSFFPLSPGTPADWTSPVD